MPWSSENRNIADSDLSILDIKSQVIEEVVSWSTIQAGKIPSNEILLSSGILDEELLQHLREERLATMLADEVLEKDEVWVEYEFEESQVKLDIADMVLEQLVSEIIDSFS